MYTCRGCERPINQATEICPYCGTDLTVPVEEPAADARPKKKPILAAVLRWGVLLAAMWAFLWFVLPERRGDHTQAAEAAAIAALREISQALEVYAEASGGYPSSLEPLGDRARRPAQQAQSQGYRLLYTPEPAAAEGPGGPARRGGLAQGFTLQARAGHYGYRNFYVDETGILRATSENRPATAQDPAEIED